MPTPKIDKIITAFSYRIGQAPVFSSSVLQDGDTLSALQVMAYVNRAMFDLFNRYWQEVKGDKQKFIQIFPELLKTRNIVIETESGQTIYTFANPNLDYFTIIDAAYNTTYMRILSSDLLNVVKTSYSNQYTASTDRPIIIESNGKLNVFPSDFAGTLGKSISISILIMPTDPTTGGYLTQNGTYDSPFNDQWNDELIRIAEELYKQDRQRDS